MISALSLFGIYRWFKGSLLAQIVAGALALGAVWKVNNVVVAKKAVKKVVQASKQEGRKRNARVKKLRRRIVRTTAMQRLRKEYAQPNRGK